LTEMYGVFKAEFCPDNKDIFYFELLNHLKQFDRIVWAGQAMSHCLLRSVEQAAQHFQNDRKFTENWVVLEDCTSCVQHPQIDFKAISDAKFDEFEQKNGIKRVKSTNFSLI
jgi:nicotinamidase-related amidase